MIRLPLVLLLLIAQVAFGQLTPEQVKEQAMPTVAMVLASRQPPSTPAAGVGVVIHQTGVLLVPFSLVKDAYAVQVRFQNGEVFDDVQMLGVDERRGVAAIKVSSSALKVRPVVLSEVAKPGDSLTVISHLGVEPWAAVPGSYAEIRMADDVPGAGSGFKIVQFRAPAAGGSNGGAVVLDSQARLLGLAVGSIAGGDALNVAVPIDTVVGLASAIPSWRFSSGASLVPPSGVRGGAARVVPQVSSQGTPAAGPGAPERSDALAASNDKDFVVRNFKTMFVDARNAKYFDAAQLKAQLGRNKDFAKLGITIVEDRNLADTVLEVNYTFAWDYPFVLKHQNSSMVLVSGKGFGPLSGIAGAANVTSEFSKVTKPFRQTAQKKK